MNRETGISTASCYTGIFQSLRVRKVATIKLEATHDKNTIQVLTVFISEKKLEPSVDSSSKELEAEREQRKQVERRLEEETVRAERERGRATDAEQNLEH